MTTLVCGPFESEGSLRDTTITFPIATNGDWVKTPEGQGRLKKAVSELEQACGEGRLPNNLQVQWVNNDEARISIPMPQHPPAILLQPKLVSEVLAITGASESTSYRGVDRIAEAKSLVCGPFSATQGRSGIKVVIPVFLQGSLAHTYEGAALLQKAGEKLAEESDKLKLPDDMQFDFINENHAVIRIPCKTFHEAEVKAKQLKRTLPALLGAAVLEPMRDKDL